RRRLMPLQALNLDDRTFEDIYREARLRIPRYAPGWTDYNDSDPGIALLQLFAWLTELMIYRLNRVPEASYIKFLHLLDLELRPAQPAEASLTFTPKPGADVQPVPARSGIGAQPAGGGPPLVFETETGLDLVPMLLTDVQVYDGVSFTVVTRSNEADGV